MTSKELEKEMKDIDKESRETYKKQSKDKKESSILNYTYPNADPKAANLKALADHIALTKALDMQVKIIFLQLSILWLLKQL